MNEPSSTSSVSLLDDRFGLHEVLGEGAQGTTYRAIDRKTGREVAVKLLEFDAVEEWKSVELFEREAEALENIDHPQIPDYVEAHHEYGGESEQFYLAQEYVEGTDLEEILERGETFDEGQARDFVCEMLEILDYLHGSFSPPIVHRDIKPSNIMRREDGELALIDFGAVQTVLPDETGGSTFLSMGTTGYMPPEQVKGRARPISDLYAVAMTAVHMMSGVHPTDLPMEGIEVQLGEVVDVSEDFEAVLARMLAPEAESRYADAAAALEALEHGATSTVEGREHLHHPEQIPDEMQSQVRASEERLEVEVSSSRGRWLVPGATSVGILVGLPVVGLAVWAFWDQLSGAMVVFDTRIPRPDWSFFDLSSMTDGVVFVLGAYASALLWVFGRLSWYRIQHQYTRHLWTSILLIVALQCIWFCGLIGEVWIYWEYNECAWVFLIAGIWAACAAGGIALSSLDEGDYNDEYDEQRDIGEILEFFRDIGEILKFIVGFPLLTFGMAFLSIPAVIVAICVVVPGLAGGLLRTFGGESRQFLGHLSTEGERLVVTDSRLALETLSLGGDSWETAWTLDCEHGACRVDRVGPRLNRAENAEASASVDGREPLLPALALTRSSEDIPKTFGTRTRYLIGPVVGLVYEWWTGTKCAHRDPNWHRELDWLADEIESKLAESSDFSDAPDVEW